MMVYADLWRKKDGWISRGRRVNLNSLRAARFHERGPARPIRCARLRQRRSFMADKPGLDRLYFGKDDAESDFARGGLLRQGFMRTRAYDEALAGSKTLIIGRKGSGKSAICLMLKNDLQAEDRCSLISPDEISTDEIRRFHLPGIPPEQSKLLIWRYVFAVQVAK